MNHIDITPAMREVLEYFGELGPRWGLRSELTRAHALLYLVGRPVRLSDLAQCMGLDKAFTESIIDELDAWRMVTVTEAGVCCRSDEPWDLLFAAIDERRRRELAPAMQALKRATESARNDGTPRRTTRRITELTVLVHDLAALGDRIGGLSSRSLTRLTRVGGSISRYFSSSDDKS